MVFAFPGVQLLQRWFTCFRRSGAGDVQITTNRCCDIPPVVISALVRHWLPLIRACDLWKYGFLETTPRSPPGDAGTARSFGNLRSALF